MFRPSASFPHRARRERVSRESQVPVFSRRSDGYLRRWRHCVISPGPAAHQANRSRATHGTQISEISQCSLWITVSTGASQTLKYRFLTPETASLGRPDQEALAYVSQRYLHTSVRLPQVVFLNWPHVSLDMDFRYATSLPFPPSPISRVENPFPLGQIA